MSHASRTPCPLSAVAAVPHSRSVRDRHSGARASGAPPDGRKYRMLNVLDEFSHECLAIRVARKLKVIGVIDAAS